jgi:general secretion pathway protein A
VNGDWAEGDDVALTAGRDGGHIVALTHSPQPTDRVRVRVVELSAPRRVLPLQCLCRAGIMPRPRRPTPMYTSFFGLGEKPFAITPDPRYLFMSERHAEALAHLLYGITEAGGFIQLTGEVGTGKTTIVRTLLERIPGHADVAVILNPQLNPIQFLLAICQELGIFLRDGDEDSVKELVDLLNRRLLEAHAKGRRVVVIVDEAQNLSPETLEQVRLLTNLETPSQKLLQIILIGQPELREVLARNDLRQLAQRVTGRYHLDPLSQAETAAYVKHRLKVAGAQGELFAVGALREIHRITGGVPRMINIVADRALLGAYTEENPRISAKLVRQAASEVLGHPVSPRWFKALASIGASAAVVGLSLGIWLLLSSSAPVKKASAAQPVVIAPPIEKAVVEAPVPKTQDVNALLSSSDAQSTPEATFARLAQLWDAKVTASSIKPCDQVLKQGLECVQQKGSWGELLRLNRPAILTLADPSGVEHKVLLTGLSADTATIDVSGTSHQVTVSSMARAWLGDYLLLWRPHVAGQRPLAVGAHGDQVRWLRSTLRSARGEKDDAPVSDVYDAELAHMVEDFQRHHRLEVDGIAGVQTQLLLDALASSESAPRLLAATAGG